MQKYRKIHRSVRVAMQKYRKIRRSVRVARQKYRKIHRSVRVARQKYRKIHRSVRVARQENAKHVVTLGLTSTRAQASLEWLQNPKHGSELLSMVQNGPG